MNQNREKVIAMMQKPECLWSFTYNSDCWIECHVESRRDLYDKEPLWVHRGSMVNISIPSWSSSDQIPLSSDLCGPFACSFSAASSPTSCVDTFWTPSCGDQSEMTGQVIGDQTRSARRREHSLSCLLLTVSFCLLSRREMILNN